MKVAFDLIRADNTEQRAKVLENWLEQAKNNPEAARLLRFLGVDIKDGESVKKLKETILKATEGELDPLAIEQLREMQLRLKEILGFLTEIGDGKFAPAGSKPAGDSDRSGRRSEEEARSRDLPPPVPPPPPRVQEGERPKDAPPPVPPPPPPPLPPPPPPRAQESVRPKEVASPVSSPSDQAGKVERITDVDRVLELLAQAADKKSVLPEIGQTIRVTTKEGVVLEIRRSSPESTREQPMKPSDTGGKSITDVAKVLELLKASKATGTVSGSAKEAAALEIGKKYRVVLKDGSVLEFERKGSATESSAAGGKLDGLKREAQSKPIESTKEEKNGPVEMTSKKPPLSGRQGGESPDPELARQGRLQGQADARAALEGASRSTKPNANTSGSESGAGGQSSGGTDRPSNEKSVIVGRGGKPSPDPELARQGREVGRADVEAARRQRETNEREALASARKEAQAMAQKQRDEELARRAQERAQAIEDQQKQERERQEREKGKGGRSR